MSLLGWLTGKTECPLCGDRGAKKIQGRVHCPNSTCSYFSPTLGNPEAAQLPVTFPEPGDVPTGSVVIQYRNFRGAGRTFVVEAASARRARNHFSVKVEPRGARITLSRDRIANLREVEAALSQFPAAGQIQPTPRERQVMGYHKKHGTTSPLYASIREKYRDGSW